MTVKYELYRLLFSFLHVRGCKFDATWESCSGFHFYDYNDPTNIAEGCQGAFDLIVIDPPFIRSVCEIVIFSFAEKTSVLIPSAHQSVRVGKLCKDCKDFVEK